MAEVMDSRSDAQLRTQPQDEAPTPRRWLVLAVLAAVAFMAQLDLYIVNVAVPALAHAFPGSTLSSLSWVLNAYAIVFAALLVPAGRLADQFGRRRFLIAGVALFTLASVVCAIAPVLPVIVIGRLLQGIGAAMIVPTSLGLLWPAFPDREHNLVVGIWAGVAAVAGASGPTLGGLLVGLDWRWIFLINVPIGAATIIGGLLVLPEVRAQRGARLPDTLSGVTLLAAITLLTLATVQSSQWGWTSTGVLLLLAGAVITGAVTVWRTITHPHALIQARLFRSRQFSTASVALFLFFVGFATWLLISVLFLENAWHYSALRTGLAIGPGPLTSAVFAVNNGRITGWFGRRIPAIVGTLSFAAAGLFWLIATPASSAYLTGFLPGLILCGIGAGLTQAPLFAAASTLPDSRATTGSAVLNMSRQVGSAIGVAILVALLAGSHSGGLTTYHRGWLFLTLSCLAATVAVLLSGRTPSIAPSRQPGTQGSGEAG
jgi:EmrB/QacA subfamily drug resistance transporter